MRVDASAAQDMPGASLQRPGGWAGVPLVAAVAGTALMLSGAGLTVAGLPGYGMIFLTGGVLLIAVGRASRS